MLAHHVVHLFGRHIGILAAGRSEQVFQEDTALLVRITAESVEESIVIVNDYLLHDAELDFRNLGVRPFPYHQDKAFQEVNLLYVVFVPAYFKWIHRDRLFLRIGDILASQIFAQPFV